MASLTLTTSYRKNNNLLFSADELLSVYFYGTDIESQDGTDLANSTIEFYLKAAQEEVERYFGVKLFPELLVENVDYNRDDYEYNFPFVKVSAPVRKARTLIGRINSFDQIVYPEEWLVEKASSEKKYHRQFSIIPNGSVVNANADVVFTGVTSYYGLRSYPNIPNYWYVQYETGYKYGEVPRDIMHLIGMLASIPLLAIAGDLILGAGIASQSLGIDGLSQSISSTSSATNAGYGARIVEYRKTIDSVKKEMRKAYKGVNFTVC
jgi:hypothetical protein